MHPNPDRDRIAAYYDQLVDKYGYSRRALDVLRKDSLLVRYQVLSEVLNLTGKRVLEVGCGFGDLGAFLKTRYKNLEYVGVDISLRMIEVGSQIHPDLDLRHKDILGWPPSDTFDVVLAQGLFYLLEDDAERKMHLLIRTMFNLAKEALAFCTLSTWASTLNDGEFHADPLKTTAFCRQLTSRLVLRHDYLPNDFAVYLYRSESRKSRGSFWTFSPKDSR